MATDPPEVTPLKEREKPGPPPPRKQRGLRSWDTTPADDSANERYYNRSVKIRRQVITWLDSHVGYGWIEKMGMADDCANSGKPYPFSSQAAYSWIRQFTAPTFAFGIQSPQLDPDGLYRIYRRRPLDRKDFRRWGVPVPRVRAGGKLNRESVAGSPERKASNGLSTMGIASPPIAREQSDQLVR